MKKDWPRDASCSSHLLAVYQRTQTAASVRNAYMAVVFDKCQMMPRDLQRYGVRDHQIVVGERVITLSADTEGKFGDQKRGN